METTQISFYCLFSVLQSEMSEQPYKKDSNGREKPEAWGSQAGLRHACTHHPRFLKSTVLPVTTFAGHWQEEESNFSLKSGNQSELAELDGGTWAILPLNVTMHFCGENSILFWNWFIPTSVCVFVTTKGHSICPTPSLTARTALTPHPH